MKQEIATIRHLPISTVRGDHPLSRTGTQVNTSSRMVGRHPRRDITNTHMAVQHLQMDITNPRTEVRRPRKGIVNSPMEVHHPQRDTASILMKVGLPQRDTANAPTMVRRHRKDIVTIHMVARPPNPEAILASISHLRNTIAAHPLPARTQYTLTPKGNLPFRTVGFLNGIESISAGTTPKKPQGIPSGRRRALVVLITAVGDHLETIVTILKRTRVMVVTVTPHMKAQATATTVTLRMKAQVMAVTVTRLMKARATIATAMALTDQDMVATDTDPGMTRMATRLAIILATTSIRPGATTSTKKQLR